MTASKYIKSQGLPSTKFVADKVGKPVQTINNWFKYGFALFRIVVLGAVLDVLLPKIHGVWRNDDKDAVLVIDENGIRLVTGTDHATRGLLYERENDERD